MTLDTATESLADPQVQRILAAARSEFEQYGVRRSTMDDIALRAGVGRRTLYRRFTTKDALFELLVRHETDALLEQLARASAGCEPGAAVAECFTLFFDLLERSPLARRIVASEPELLPVSAGRPRGLPIVEAGDRVAKTLRRSGVTMPEADLRAVSELLIRLALSLLLNPEGRLDISDPAAVRTYSRRYLARLVW
ncbi:TetR/AcrR family transcriptional regulator [Nocardia testacea]|uniref:TetR/AcrR family transcriptional regulator n=1 Tax=Nocardia testacea TaxID=248551 RepID=UPI00031D95F7|nr:TetR/AcrR family transcriptional regulator [Nocardia testacea]